MRIVQKHPHNSDAKEEKDKDDQDWETSRQRNAASSKHICQTDSHQIRKIVSDAGILQSNEVSWSVVMKLCSWELIWVHRSAWFENLAVGIEFIAKYGDMILLCIGVAHLNQLCLSLVSLQGWNLSSAQLLKPPQVIKELHSHHLFEKTGCEGSEKYGKGKQPHRGERR
ncbi:death-associated protein 1 isoform X3 [Apteryx rowi]|nr:death-associated protein 1 isoform X3 [Apteryx rowi]